MKIALVALMALLSQPMALQASPAHGDGAEPVVGATVLAYTGFSESRAAQLVVATREFIGGQRTAAAANKLTGDIMRASTQSEPYYHAALRAASGNPGLTSAIEAFRAEELRLPRKLGNTDETELDDVVGSLVELGDEVERALSVGGS